MKRLIKTNTVKVYYEEKGEIKACLVHIMPERNIKEFENSCRTALQNEHPNAEFIQCKNLGYIDKYVVEIENSFLNYIIASYLADGDQSGGINITPVEGESEEEESEEGESEEEESEEESEEEESEED